MKEVILFVSYLLVSVQISAATFFVGKGQHFKNIRSAIEYAAEGDTIMVSSGHYHEAELVVEKRLTLIGLDYPVLDGDYKYEVLTLNASHCAVIGFEICRTGTSSTQEIAGLKVQSADYVIIESNRFRDCTFGIYLSRSDHCVISNNDIQGIIKEEQNSGNGIHLWNCAEALIEGNNVSGQRDGIYFEFVNNSEITSNNSERNLRYGLHFMFSHEDKYHHNRFYQNGAGVAVMYSRKVEMTENEFGYNWGSAAYGILLKEITDSYISSNVFEHNSAAVFMEGASRIILEQNIFKENGWALRIQASCDANVIRENNFFSNSFDVSTNGHLVLNSFEHNYWDRYEGYDLNHDGIGDIPYRPVSLYAIVVERMPYGLMFMRSIMVYLMDKAEKIIPSLTPEQLVDKMPAIKSLEF